MARTVAASANIVATQAVGFVAQPAGHALPLPAHRADGPAAVEVAATVEWGEEAEPPPLRAAR